MVQWSVKVGSRRCPYNDGYGGCSHKKVIERTGEFQPPCRNKYCPIKIKHPLQPDQY